MPKQKHQSSQDCLGMGPVCAGVNVGLRVWGGIGRGKEEGGGRDYILLKAQ